MGAALTIVAPVYNEKESIAKLVESAAAKIHHEYRLFAVYDRDEDTTLPVLERLSKTHPEIRMIKNAYKPGALEAIRTGIEAAPPGAVVVTMADLSDDLSAVDGMYELYDQGCDVVCGSRYMRGGRQVGGPLIKRTMSRLAGVSLHYLTGIPTRDVTNSFKLYSKEFFDTLEIESTGGFEIGMEIVIKAFLAGRRIAEVPTRWMDRTSGKSNFNVRRLLPHYLHWYFYALRGRAKMLFGGGRKPAEIS